MVSGHNAPHCKWASKQKDHLRVTGQFTSRLGVLSLSVWVASMVLGAMCRLFAFLASFHGPGGVS